MTELTAFPDAEPDDATEERVVLCSPDGQAIGAAAKSQVHHRDTPLHLAFSCYVFDASGRTLVSRRARTKRVFPGIRTNSCCGHPAPGESMTAAVRRRLRQELGVVVTSVDLVLPTFRYRATAADGTVENELCPVFRATASQVEIVPDRTEVDDAWWVPWAQFCSADDAGSDPLSPWAAEQVRQLVLLGPDPLSWSPGEAALLPPAALP